MKHNPETMRYASMGMAALLPGMQYAIERMQAELDNMRARLAAMQNGDAPGKRRGRPPGKHAGSGWSDDPEERRREMARRMAKRGKETVYQTEAFRQKMSAIGRKRWARMKATERKALTGKIAAGHKTKKPAVPTVRMQEAV